MAGKTKERKREREATKRTIDVLAVKRSCDGSTLPKVADEGEHVLFELGSSEVSPTDSWIMKESRSVQTVRPVVQELVGDTSRTRLTGLQDLLL